jgi:hypothetical protein
MFEIMHLATVVTSTFGFPALGFFLPVPFLMSTGIILILLS